MSDARNTPIVKAARAVGPAVVGITNKAYVRDFSTASSWRNGARGPASFMTSRA